MSRFVHLHLHSEYSLLDGACRVRDIPQAAKEAGHTAVALTDHGVLYGAVAFYRACKDAGIKPIIGCEVYVAERSRFSKEGRSDASGNHLILLVENEKGYKNLIYLVSKSFTEGFYSKPRIDLELLRAHHEGLIALSACMAGAVPRAILAGDMEGAVRIARELNAIFGAGNFYLELQDHRLQDDQMICRGLRTVSERTGIPMVATNDVHYLRRADAEMQQLLLCIQTGRTVAEGRPIGFETDEFYYKTTEEMERLFPELPDALENTAKIADRCNFDFTFGKYTLPSFPETDGIPHARALRDLAFRGLDERAARGEIDFALHPRDEYISRIEYELSVIDKMGFNEYYLIVRDFVTWAKTHGVPVGPGRGSGAGSLVAYCVGITEVDSLRFNLLFERFLNPERISMPDFDVDFSDEKRDRVIAYVKEKYGEDHVSQIVTFGTLAPRASVRDVGRALGMPYSDVDRVAGRIGLQDETIDGALKRPELREMYDSSEETRRLIDTAKRVEGMPRHASTHAAGIVITKEPVSAYVPLAVSGEATVTQFDMDTVALLGLVKFDFLGIRYLSVIEETETTVRKKEPGFDLAKIDLDDPAVYRMISAGQTLGVFQLEKNGMRRVLRRLKPTCFEDLIAVIALYRPGPMDSIETFVRRKHGEEPITYEIPELKEILDVTYGCIVYQEQVMQIFRLLADYSLARADLVRRAISKKKADVLEKERNAFLEGTARHGIDPEKATALFDEIAAFADYAFNRNHAAAYAMLVYRTAYLKARYPREYMAALMSSVVGRTDKLAEYTAECARSGIRVLPPDVGCGEIGFSVTREGIRFGLLAVKGVGRQFLEMVIAERNRRQFSDFPDLIRRLSGRELNRRQVEALIKCGALDFFGETRRTLIEACESLIAAEQTKARSAVSGQMDFFSLGGEDVAPKTDYPRLPEYDRRELIAFERDAIGTSFSGNPLDDYADDEKNTPHTPLSELRRSPDEEDEPEDVPAGGEKETVSVLGVVSTLTEKDTKNGDRMAFLTLADRTGEIEVIVFPKLFRRVSSYLRPESGIAVTGEVDLKEGANAKILAQSIRPLRKNGEEDRRGRTLYLRVPSLDSPEAKRAVSEIENEPGEIRVVFYDLSKKTYANYTAHGASGSPGQLARLTWALGEGSVVLR